MWLWVERLLAVVRRSPKTEKQESPAPAILARVEETPRIPLAAPLWTQETWPGFDRTKTWMQRARDARDDRDEKELLRRRLKHDKWVKPKGEKPPPKPRAPRPKKPKVLPGLGAPLTPALADDRRWGSGNTLLADVHHEDTELVLYKEQEMWRQFYFRDTILDHLDRYFFYLGRMKKFAPDAYGLHKHKGITLLPYVAIGANYRDYEPSDELKRLTPELAAWFHAIRPTFGAYVWAADSEAEKHEAGKPYCMPRVFYFTKMERPHPDIEPKPGPGDIYTMSLYWDTPHAAKKWQRKNSGTSEFYMFVSADGTDVHVLKTYGIDWTEIRSKRAAPRSEMGERRPWFAVPSRGYRIDPSYKRWARSRGQTAEEFLRSLFLNAVARHTGTQFSTVRINIHNKDGLTAVFGVDVTRLAYFFKDRDISVTVNGRRRPIFHMTRGYRRKDGAVVPWYFSGLKRFTWADYDVHITVPERDHINIEEINYGTTAQEYLNRHPEPYLDMNGAGKFIAKFIEEELQPGEMKTEEIDRFVYNQHLLP